jgi:hypothetical protein
MNTLPEWEQDKTQKATEGLLPFKSQDKYEKDYEIFRIWQSKYEIATVSATVLLAYFQELVSFTVKLFSNFVFSHAYALLCEWCDEKKINNAADKGCMTRC